MTRPSDFWLPLMGLFTGERISELCQLDIADIQQHQGIWAVSINADGNKSLKTLAARRLIPIHAERAPVRLLSRRESEYLREH